MLSIARLLLKTVIRKFYERNVGFFLFLFFLMFGIVESSQLVYFHLSLINGIISSIPFLLLVGLLWLLYLVKCVAFIIDYQEASKNSFLLQLNLLPYPQKIAALFFIIILTYAPVIDYTILIVGVAIYQREHWVATSIVLFQLIAVGSASLLLELKMRLLKTLPFRWPSLKLNRPLPYPAFFLSALFHRQKMALFLTKAFSFFAILGFMTIPLDHYEYRIGLMGFLFGLAAHAVLVFEFRKLEDQRLTFARQLPLPFVTRFIYILMTYAAILLPELILLLVNPIRLVDGLFIYFFGIAFLLFCHCSLLKNQLNMDNHIRNVTLLFLVGFGLILFRLAIPASLILISIAYLSFQKNYYLYEMQ